MTIKTDEPMFDGPTPRNYDEMECTCCVLGNVFNYVHEGERRMGFSISYGIKNFGFGEVSFCVENGVLVCDSETMPKEFVEFILKQLLKRCEFCAFHVCGDNVPAEIPESGHCKKYDPVLWDDDEKTT